jgi:hypothetical protein
MLKIIWKEKTISCNFLDFIWHKEFYLGRGITPKNNQNLFYFCKN